MDIPPRPAPISRRRPYEEARPRRETRHDRLVKRRRIYWWSLVIAVFVLFISIWCIRIQDHELDKLDESNSTAIHRNRM